MERECVDLPFWGYLRLLYDRQQPMRAAVPLANAGRRAASQCVTNDGSWPTSFGRARYRYRSGIDMSLRASAHAGVAIHSPKCSLISEFSDKPELFRKRIPTVASLLRNDMNFLTYWRAGQCDPPFLLGETDLVHGTKCAAWGLFSCCLT